MWAYDFMRHALFAGLIIATVCGVVSVFVVLRRTAFAAHALGHMSLTGAAGAVILGIPTIVGQLVLNLMAAFVMGLMGDKIKKNDLAVGVVLAFVLGCGAYFLFLFQSGYAGGVMSILFGNILAVSVDQIWILSMIAILVIMSLIVFARPLIFSSIDPTLAESKNISTSVLAIVFFIIIAFTVSMACQIVGALLVFVMLIIPGAIAVQWGDCIYKIMLISILVANFAVVVALIIAYYFDLPVSFCITTLLSLVYCLGLLKNRFYSI